MPARRRRRGRRAQGSPRRAPTPRRSRYGWPPSACSTAQTRSAGSSAGARCSPRSRARAARSRACSGSSARCRPTATRSAATSPRRAIRPCRSPRTRYRATSSWSTPRESSRRTTSSSSALQIDHRRARTRDQASGRRATRAPAPVLHRELELLAERLQAAQIGVRGALRPQALCKVLARRLRPLLPRRARAPCEGDAAKRRRRAARRGTARGARSTGLTTARTRRFTPPTGSPPGRASRCPRSG